MELNKFELEKKRLEKTNELLKSALEALELAEQQIKQRKAAGQRIPTKCRFFLYKP
ncbi:hypothetical protein [Pseudobacillus badius]|uniref:hypothetical protein n=1 Tax=Bacillus badius TaxID=1455 RepID=UPI000B2CFDBC|nr:hypothetical protein [Bacillus badius]